MPVEFSFQVDLAMPVGMTGTLQRDITTALQPRWRVTQVELRELERGAFRLRLAITVLDDEFVPPEDYVLRAFRDLVVSLVAFAAMVPVRLLSQGTFDFPVAGNERQATSLGPMVYELPPAPLSDLQPLVRGLALEEKYVPALHFLWEAISSEHALYRFINLAIAVELIVRHDSPVHGSRQPKCGNPKCGVPDRGLPRMRTPLADPFAASRACSVPNPGRDALGLHSREEPRVSRSCRQTTPGVRPQIAGLNMSLLLVLRNYLGEKMDLPPLTPAQLSVALDPPRVSSMTIHYRLPDASTQVTI
jgi:hypothetical protein